MVTRTSIRVRAAHRYRACTVPAVLLPPHTPGTRGSHAVLEPLSVAHHGLQVAEPCDVQRVVRRMQVQVQAVGVRVRPPVPMPMAMPVSVTVLHVHKGSTGWPMWQRRVPG